MKIEAGQAMMALASGLGGAGSTAIAAFFLKDFFASTKEAFKEIARKMSERERVEGVLQASIQDVVHELRVVTRDLLRMQGVMESQQKAEKESLREFAALQSSLKALWVVMQRVFPDHVPTRISDRLD